MKRVTLQDNAAGNALGWNPDGVQTNFGIEEDRHFGGDSTMVSIIVESLPLGSTNHLCDPVNVASDAVEGFDIVCSSAPPEGSVLHYVVTVLPPHTP